MNKTALVLLFYLAVTILTALLLAPVAWPIGLAVWVILDMFLLLGVVAWHARATVYTCPECGNTFTISLATEITSPHGIKGGGWKHLRCPRCGKTVKASVKERP